MPYTQDELQSVGYYNEFINKLREIYLEKLAEAGENGFRDVNNVLLSYEDIFTGFSIEDVDISKGPYLQVLRKGYTENMPEDVINGLEDLRQLLYTRQFEKYPKYTKGKLLEKTIDRNISELSTSTFLTELPGDLTNGDVITVDVAEDLRKWVIQNGQKRIFPDLATFFGYGYQLTDLKAVEEGTLKSIPSGDDIE